MVTSITNQTKAQQVGALICWQRTAQLPAFTAGGSQPPLTPLTGDLIPSLDL